MAADGNIDRRRLLLDVICLETGSWSKNREQGSILGAGSIEMTLVKVKLSLSRAVEAIEL
jgi:hypothetical protein